jgi:hypothetical protein
MSGGTDPTLALTVSDSLLPTAVPETLATPEPGTPADTTPGIPADTTPSVLSKADLTYIYGANRILTSVAISQQGWTSAHTVVIAPAGDNNLIDALVAAPLAGQENAPILLSMNYTLDAAVLAEIQRLGATKVYVVGALEQTVVNQLQAALPALAVEVLKGATRIETAAQINAKVNNPQGTFVVGYNAIADAVSAVSFAAAHAYIIQIARPDGSFTGNAPLGGYILGGPTLVRDIAGLTRLYGADRYATNQAICSALPFTYDILYIADGDTLVDALTGSVLAAQTNSAILLAPKNDPTGLTLDKITAETIIYALGGAK